MRIKDLKNWKDTPYPRVRKVNIVKMLILFELIYQFRSYPIKIPANFLTDKLTLLFLLNAKELKKTKQLYNNNNELHN